MLGMKKILYSFGLLASIYAIASCAKDKLWLDEASVERTLLKGELKNKEDGQFLKGVKILIERQTQSNGENSYVDTVSTDADGKFSYEVPFPNKVRVVVRDTARYEADTAFVVINDNRDYAVTLQSAPRFGVSIIAVNVLDNANSPLQNINVALYLRESNSESYSAVDTFLTNNEGKVQFENIAFPVNYKVKIAEREIAYDLDSLEGKLSTKNPLQLLLKTRAKFSQGDVVLMGKYFFTNTYASNTSFYISYKSILDAEFSTPELKTFDSNGKLVLPNAVFPAEVKITPASGVQYPFNPESFIIPEEAKTNPVVIDLFDVAPRFNNKTPSSNIVENTLEVLAEGNQIFTMEVDSRGNIFATTADGKIIKITPEGEQSEVASGFTNLWGIALVDDNTLYVSENNNRHAIYKIVINPNTGVGTSTLFAGAVGSTGTTDGNVTAARFNRPSDIVYDKSRNCLWLGEWQNSRIRKIDLVTNAVSTFKAGIGFYFGISLSADNKSLYLASHTNNAGLYKYDIDNDVLYILRTGLGSTRHVAVTPDDKIFFTTNGNGALRLLSNPNPVVALANNTANASSGTVSTVAGGSNSSGNSPAVGYKGAANIPIFDSGDPGVTGLVYDAYRGRLYVSSFGNRKLYFIKLSSTY